MARTKTMAKKKGKGKKGKKSRGRKGKRKTAPAKGGVERKKHRWRPGTVALRDIKKY